MMPRVRYSQIAVLLGEIKGQNEHLFSSLQRHRRLSDACAERLRRPRRVLLAYSRTSLIPGSSFERLNECRTAVVISQRCGSKPFGITAAT